MQEEVRNAYKIMFEKLNGRSQLEHVGVNVIIILKYIFKG